MNPRKGTVVDRPADPELDAKVAELVRALRAHLAGLAIDWSKLILGQPSDALAKSLGGNQDPTSVRGGLAEHSDRAATAAGLVERILFQDVASLQVILDQLQPPVPK